MDMPWFSCFDQSHSSPSHVTFPVSSSLTCSKSMKVVQELQRDQRSMFNQTLLMFSFQFCKHISRHKRQIVFFTSILRRLVIICGCWGPHVRAWLCSGNEHCCISPQLSATFTSRRTICQNTRLIPKMHWRFPLIWYRKFWNLWWRIGFQKRMSSASSWRQMNLCWSRKHKMHWKITIINWL